MMSSRWWKSDFGCSVHGILSQAWVARYVGLRSANAWMICLEMRLQFAPSQLYQGQRALETYASRSEAQEQMVTRSGHVQVWTSKLEQPRNAFDMACPPKSVPS